jgi:hypothetical protein
LAIFYSAVSVVLMVILLANNPKTTWPGYLLVATGVPVYFLWKRRGVA